MSIMGSPLTSGTSCPIPLTTGDMIVMGHGGGGRLSAELLSSIFLPAFSNPVIDALEDQATLSLNKNEGTIAITTDAFVVRPIFFPGGDIGRLSICGTVNDLVVGGARPRWITAAFVLEEGLLIEDLRRIVKSMQAACVEAGVKLIAGDTKVVDRGKGDKIYMTTTGLGVVPSRGPNRHLSVGNAKPGDSILVSGNIGDHGIAVMSVREGLEMETTVVSDVAPLGGLAELVLEAAPTTRCMRDPTRGGVASTLHEIANRSGVGVVIDEQRLPIDPSVRAACELLGFDPLFVANEGKLVAIVPSDEAEAARNAMLAHPLGRNARVIGRVVSDHSGVVRMKTVVGGERVVAMLAGEQLPRIC